MCHGAGVGAGSTVEMFRLYPLSDERVSHRSYRLASGCLCAQDSLEEETTEEERRVGNRGPKRDRVQDRGHRKMDRVEQAGPNSECEGERPVGADLCAG